VLRFFCLFPSFFLFSFWWRFVSASCVPDRWLADLLAGVGGRTAAWSLVLV